jgi:hypothetical protein
LPATPSSKVWIFVSCSEAQDTWEALQPLCSETVRSTGRNHVLDSPPQWHPKSNEM